MKILSFTRTISLAARALALGLVLPACDGDEDGEPACQCNCWAISSGLRGYQRPTLPLEVGPAESRHDDAPGTGHVVYANPFIPMKYRTRIIAFVLVSALLGACGATEGSNGQPDTPQTDDPCEQHREAATCGDSGVMYCDGQFVGGMWTELMWGPCTEDPQCVPGDYFSEPGDENCGGIYDTSCVLIEGIPEWEPLECDE
jgi:hypothetical protein